MHTRTHHSVINNWISIQPADKEAEHLTNSYDEYWETDRQRETETDRQTDWDGERRSLIWCSFNGLFSIKCFSLSAPVVSMGNIVYLLVFLAVLLSHPGWVSTQTNCPWEQEGLLRWSKPRTWDNGSVPRRNDEVRIDHCLNWKS